MLVLFFLQRKKMSHPFEIGIENWDAKHSKLRKGF